MEAWFLLGNPIRRRASLAFGRRAAKGVRRVLTSTVDRIAAVFGASVPIVADVAATQSSISTAAQDED